jgi:hypothetical protein
VDVALLLLLLLFFLLLLRRRRSRRSRGLAGGRERRGQERGQGEEPAPAGGPQAEEAARGREEAAELARQALRVGVGVDGGGALPLSVARALLLLVVLVRGVGCLWG